MTSARGALLFSDAHRWCGPWRKVPTVVVSSIWGPVASSPESHRLRRYVMTTIPSTAVVVYEPDLVDPEHVPLAGFVGG